MLWRGYILKHLIEIWEQVKTVLLHINLTSGENVGPQWVLLCIGRVVSTMALVGASVLCESWKRRGDIGCIIITVRVNSMSSRLICGLYTTLFWMWEHNVSEKKYHHGFCKNRLRIADVFSMQFLGRERKRDRSPSKAEILQPPLSSGTSKLVFVV